MENKEIVLSVKDLRVNFSTDNGYVQAVRGVSFDLYKGETLCIVGESGSGKSVTSKTIMGILSANGRIVSGSIMYEGEDLTKVSEDEFHRIRGHKIGMIFQDPLSSLNPIMRIGKQITEAMLLNGNHLKKMRKDLTAGEFVAYKNAITVYNGELNKTKETIKFLKSEKKKELERVKNVAKNESDGKIYALKQDYGLEKVNINHKFKKLLEEQPENAAQIKEQKAQELKKAHENFVVAKNQIIEEAKSKQDSNRENLASIKSNFDQKIKEAKTQKSASRKDIKEKYRPIIAEAKAKYLEKDKEAKMKVNEAKAQYKEEYLNDLHDLEEKRPEVSKAAKEKYESALKEAISESNDRLKESKKGFVKFVVKTKFLVPLFRLFFDKEFKAKKASIKKQYRDEIFPVSKASARNRYISKIRITKAEAKEKALKIMAEVGIPSPETRFKQYPFEFSGGMRQRIVIAIALTADPDILICDEPTTALDVTIQAQILELINRIKAERNMTCIFITHDLGVVANMADRVAVMYAGKIVEFGTEEEIFYDPKHPYTWALLSSIPDVDSKERLEAIPGTPPNLIYPPQGDAFALRSKYAMKIDFKKEPPLFKVSDTHYAATWLLDKRAPKVEMPAIVKTRIEASLAANKARMANKPTEEEKAPVAAEVEEEHTAVKLNSELAFEQHDKELAEEVKKNASQDKKGGKR